MANLHTWLLNKYSFPAPSRTLLLWSFLSERGTNRSVLNIDPKTSGHWFVSGDQASPPAKQMVDYS